MTQICGTSTLLYSWLICGELQPSRIPQLCKASLEGQQKPTESNHHKLAIKNLLKILFEVCTYKHSMSDSRVNIQLNKINSTVQRGLCTLGMRYSRVSWTVVTSSRTQNMMVVPWQMAMMMISQTCMRKNTSTHHHQTPPSI